MDGSTEQLNTVIEVYLHHWCSYTQDDWHSLLPMTALHIAGRPADATGVSPFFLTHGWEMNALELFDEPQERTSRRAGPITLGERVVQRLREAVEWAQASMALAQESYEHYANTRRQPAPEYQVGDRVWLDLRNLRTDRPSQKLDARSAQFTVLAKVRSHAYRLDTPPGPHNVFHTWLLRPAITNPLPSQRQTDHQPPAIITDEGVEEYEVEKILEAGWRWVRGRALWQWQWHVKWHGWHETSWEPYEHLEDATAMDDWEAENGPPPTEQESRTRPVQPAGPHRRGRA